MLFMICVPRLRRNEGVVPQMPVLLSGTIRENILFGETSGTEEEKQVRGVAAAVVLGAAQGGRVAGWQGGRVAV